MTFMRQGFAQDFLPDDFAGGAVEGHDRELERRSWWTATAEAAGALTTAATAGRARASGPASWCAISWRRLLAGRRGLLQTGEGGGEVSRRLGFFGDRHGG